MSSSWYVGVTLCNVCVICDEDRVKSKGEGPIEGESVSTQPCVHSIPPVAATTHTTKT